MGGAFGDFGVGIAGGAVYNLASNVLGRPLGSIAAPIMAGSIVKGTRGTILATIAGFEAGRQLLSGMSANTGGGRGEM